MSNSPDDPRLTPGHPEFVQRPDQPWLKTVAKQIVEIEKLKAENTKLRGLLDYIGGVFERGEDQIDLPDLINATLSEKGGAT